MNPKKRSLLSPNPSPPEEERVVSAAAFGRFMGWFKA
jgi:hypothetical protein